MTMMAQLLFAVAAILIGIQMASQFPMVKEFTEEQKERIKDIEETAKDMEKMAEAMGTDQDADTKENLAKMKAKAAGTFLTGFEPSCYVVVGLLGISILLIVVTMSSGQSSTIIVANPGLQPQPGPAQQPAQPAQPQQPQQPGGGIRFQ